MTQIEKIGGILFVLFSIAIIIYNFSLTPSLFPANKTLRASSYNKTYSSSTNSSKINSSAASVATVSRSSSKASTLNSPININTADQKELTQLPGIGEVISQRIIDYRTEYGNFDSTLELQNVKGIGPKVFEKIRNLVTVN
jgi:comEA protein